MTTQIDSDLLSVRINSAGAEMCSVKNKADVEFIWQANKDVWPRHAPVLFPIVGKLKDNRYIFEDKEYSLSQHGFARDREFELIEKNADSCTFELRSDEESKKVYPFDFIFQIKYSLDKNNLVTAYKVINPGDSGMYFSVGAHPGFNCPLSPREKFGDYYLEFEQAGYQQTLLNNGLRSGIQKPVSPGNTKLFLDDHLFDGDALVFEKGQISQVSLCSAKSDHKISMTCPGWPYFGIWSKKGNTDFVCLEPWFGIADKESSDQQLSGKEGILFLGPKEEFSCSFSTSFH